MNQAVSRSLSTHLRDASPVEIDPPAARQLKKGFPWLKFSAPLEQEFRHGYRDQTRMQVRFNLWLAVLCIVTFFAVGNWTLDRQLNTALNLIRFLVIFPALLVGLTVTHSKLYHRVYSTMIQIMAPLFGISVAIEVLLAARQGISIFPVLVLALICINLLVGMLFYAALRSSIIVSIAYAGGLQITQLWSEQSTYNLAILLVTIAIGATACYALEKAQRTHFLEAKLLAEMASRDGLTGIHNRRMFDEHLEKVWQQAGRDNASIALLLVDIDCFKAYNDYYGHQAGDECLKQVARALTHTARRPLDLTARYGGEEFGVILYDVQRDHVEELAHRIQTNVANLELPHPASTVARQLTASIGAACVVPGSDRTCFGLIQLADEALYEAKETGRNRTIILDKEYEQMSTGSFRSRSATAAGV